MLRGVHVHLRFPMGPTVARGVPALSLRKPSFGIRFLSIHDVYDAWIAGLHLYRFSHFPAEHLRRHGQLPHSPRKA